MIGRCCLLNRLFFLTLILGLNHCATKSHKLVDVTPPHRFQNLGQCHNYVDAWMKHYTSSSPFLAMNKFADMDFSKNEIEQVIAGNKTIDLDSSAWLATNIIPANHDSSYRLFKPQWKMKLPQKLFSKSENYRFAYMRNKIHQLVQNRKKKELVVIFTGQAHAADYYSRFPEAHVRYSSNVLQQNKTFLNPDSRKFFEAILELKKENKLKNFRISPSQSSKLEENDRFHMVKGSVKKTAYWILSKAQKRATTKHITPFKEIAASDSNRNVIVMGDIHFNSSYPNFEEFPPLGCWKELGYSKITFGLEGYGSDEKNASLVTLQEYYQTVADEHPEYFEGIDMKNVHWNPIVDKMVELVRDFYKDASYFDGIEIASFGIDVPSKTPKKKVATK